MTHFEMITDLLEKLDVDYSFNDTIYNEEHQPAGKRITVYYTQLIPVVLDFDNEGNLENYLGY